MAKICFSCGKKLGFLSAKNTYGGQILCDNCYYIQYSRYRHQPLPDKLIGREISLPYPPNTVYEVNDSLLTCGFSKNKYAFHILLYLEPESGSNRRYIGIEISTGRVFEIREHIDFGDGESPTAHSAKLTWVSQEQWNMYMSGFSQYVCEKMQHFSVANAGHFIHSLPFNSGSREGHIFVHINPDNVMIYRSEFSMSFQTLSIFTLSHQQYAELRGKYTSLYDLLICARGLVPFTQKRLVWSSKDYKSFTKSFEQICHAYGASYQPNCLYVKNCGSVLYQCYMPEESIVQMMQYISTYNFSTKTALNKIIK